MSKLVVAVDGPAGSGKSSVSKAAAIKLGFGYLDTGAGYRALTLTALDKGIELEQVGELDLEQFFDYSISLDPANYWVQVAGKSVTEDIRSKRVELSVSRVASQPKVRAFMRTITRTLADRCTFPGVIVEGRDITTVVLPDANTRVLMTASEEVRLERRARELTESSSVVNQLTDRDRKDSQVVDFLNPAEGVLLLDNSELSFQASVDALIAAIQNS